MMVSQEASKQLAYGQILELRVRKTPDKEALVFRDKRCTYAELNERANRLANGLTGLGIWGDKVAILSMNNIEMVEFFYGITKIGAVGVPQNFRYVGRELQFQIDQSDCIALIFEEQYQGVVNSIRPELPKVEHYICISDKRVEGALNYEELLRTASPDEPNVFVDDDAPAFINYTAGTTGTPKGAVRTHKNNFVACTDYGLVHATSDDVYMISTPLYHSSAQQLQHMLTFIGGKTVIYPSGKFDPVEMLRVLEKEKVTWTWLVPSVWLALLMVPNVGEFDLSSLRVLHTGGAITPVELKKRMMKQWPHAAGIWDFFGMTEMNPWTIVLTGEDPPEKLGSIGRPVNNVEVRLWDDNCKDVPPGELGELVYYGPSCLKEYYKNPEATADAFKGGYFHSGDLATRDEDGYYWLRGRKKDMIVSGGENIFPAEIEEVLITHPKILESAVIGVPDPKWGETVKAVVILKEGETMTADEVISYCKQNLASYKKPTSVDFVTELPRNPVGKVLKYKLREQYSK